MPDLLPVDQISAVKHRDTRIIFKGACNQIIIVARPANAGIGMKAGNYGISILHRGALLSVIELLFTAGKAAAVLNRLSPCSIVKGQEAVNLKIRVMD
ncbi:hypothetical protein D3C73_1449070 [compost metagenome]